MDWTLVLSRIVHYAATVSAGGAIFFGAFVAPGAVSPVAFRSRLRGIVCVSLVVALVSGAAWFIVVADGIADHSLSETFSDDTLWSVLSGTQFGQVWAVRFVLALALCGLVAVRGERELPRLAAVILAASFLGSLAWAGHAGATPGIAGTLHLASDFLHLVAAGAWAGGLLPFALLLIASRGRAEAEPLSHLAVAVARFSTLGVAAVCTILLTGAVNTWNLAGGWTALIETTYGRLLTLKIFLFAVMVSVAAINRRRLSPRLADAASRERLERNSLIEVVLALLILCVVGVLGTLAPAM